MTKAKESEGAARGSALHTRGPWRLATPDELEEIDEYRPHIMAGGFYVASIYESVDEWEANAQLIADAPGMLAMLRRLEWLPDAGGNLCCPECFGHALHEPGCALRALLAIAASARSAPK